MRLVRGMGRVGLLLRAKYGGDIEKAGRLRLNNGVYRLLKIRKLSRLRKDEGE
jgi:hypothetical protein